jgi:predicted phosphoribosyltransferase
LSCTRRERLYRDDRPESDPAGRIVILVDDGLATGSTMGAAAQTLASKRPARIVVAVPIAAPETGAALAREVDEVIVRSRPNHFMPSVSGTTTSIRRVMRMCAGY